MTNLQTLVDETCRKAGAAGLVVGVDRGGVIETAAAGLANVAAEAPMLPTTPFLTGSITKVWHTTLAMQLVDEGLLDIDRAVVDYLPEFALADADATAQVKVRNLLNHSGGWDGGDLILDLGEGSAGYAAIIKELSQVGQLYPVGKYFSYNNTAWIVLAAVLERITGETWDDLLQRRLIEPLSLGRTTTDPDTALLWGPAVGTRVVDGTHVPTPQMYLPKTYAPAGATLFTTVEDTLTFLRMHMSGGTAGDRRILSASAIELMQSPTIAMPGVANASSCLGWACTQRESVTVYAHGGGSIGGQALASMVPSLDLGVVAFVNSNHAGEILGAVRDAILNEIAPSEPASIPAAADVPLAPFVGRYDRAGMTVDVSAGDGNLLVFDTTPDPDKMQGPTEFLQGFRFETVPVAADALAVAVGGKPATPPLATFLEPGADSYTYLALGGRLAKRAD
jgi:CubicO group peptidase (beta-lactamase class C family)